jgi:hypothetical protein
MAAGAFWRSSSMALEASGQAHDTFWLLPLSDATARDFFDGPPITNDTDDRDGDEDAETKQPSTRAKVLRGANMAEVPYENSEKS